MTAERKRNLTAREQVAYLRDEKGCAFELISESAAELFLEREAYFYRLKSYCKNYEKYQDPGSRKGKYVDLDFGHLVELDALDACLRDLVLDLALDVEAALKVRINRAAMEACIDPYELTRAYLAAEHERIFADQVSKYDQVLAKRGLDKALSALLGIEVADPDAALASVNAARAALDEVAAGRDPDHVSNTIARMSASNYSGGIVRHYRQDGLPYWCLLELLTLGTLVGLYKQCFKKGGLIASPKEQALCKGHKSLLRQAQSMRNAAAHADALLNALACYRSASWLKGTRRKLRERGIDGEWVDAVSSVPVAMELAALLMCHDAFVERQDAREGAAAKMRAAAGRFRRHEAWFSKCYAVSSFVTYVARLLDAFADGQEQ